MSGAGRFAGRDVLRWSAAATAAIGLHAAAVAIGYDWPMGREPAGAPITAVMIDFAPEVSFPVQQPVEAPEQGPLMEQAEPVAASDMPPPETAAAVAPPAPEPSDIPVVEHQPKQNDEEPKQKPDAGKSRQAATKAHEPTKRPPAPRTTAPPRSVRTANAAAPATLGNNAASESLSTYAARVATHIARFKQYPSAARGQGGRGIVRVSYTVTRGGQVASVRLASSSGNALLDQEAVAAVRRAQPLPPIPANLPQPQSLSTPIQFSIN